MPAISGATDHYVGPLGGTDFAAAVDAATPCDLVTGLENVWAGDRLIILDGTHTVAEQVRVNQDGTETDPITVTADAGATPLVILDHGSAAPTIDVVGNYWVFESNNIEWHYHGSGIRVGDGTAEHFYWDGGLAIALSAAMDNSGFLKLESHAHYALIENLKVDGTGLGSNGVNANVACIYTRVNLHTTIRNCELYDAPQGIYHKHAAGEDDATGELIDDDLTIEYNYIHDCDRHTLKLTTRGSTIRNNLLLGNFMLGHDGGEASGDFNLVRHNTITGNIAFQVQGEEPRRTETRMSTVMGM